MVFELYLVLYCLLAHISPFIAIRWGPEKPLLTTPELELSEACALVHSLPNWRVADTVRLSSHHSRSHCCTGNLCMKYFTLI